MNEENTAAKAPPIFALIGFAFSLFAFSLSVTTPWILDAVSPPQTESLEDLAVEKAISIKDKFVKGLKGEEFREQQVDEPKHWSDYWFLIVIGLSTVAVIFSAIGFVRKEQDRMSVLGLIIGVLAIVAQYALIFATIFIVIALISAVLNTSF